MPRSKLLQYLIPVCLCLTLLSTLSAVHASCVLKDFQHQLDTVLHHIRMTRKQHDNMDQVLQDVERALKTEWPECRIVEFGAAAMGLALKWSDGDLFVFVSNDTQIHIDNGTFVATAERVLRNHPELFKKFHIIPDIDGPTLSFVHLPTKLQVDLTFSCPATLRQATLVKHLVQLKDRIYKMAIIIKYWSYVHRIADDDPALPTYAMTILVLFYLQQNKVLPPIATLQKNIEPVILNNWNTAVGHLHYNPDNLNTLYDLLGGFFKYYSNFDFENNIISLYCGCIITKKQFENLQLPEVLSTYADMLNLGLAKPFKFGPINIQDIFQHDVNVGRPWNNRSMLDRLIKHSQFSAKTFENESSDRFLLTILKSDENGDRDLLKTLWSRGDRIATSCLAI